MEVLVLSWEYPPCSVGGLASHLYDLLPQLVNSGVEVHLITRGNEETEEYQYQNGVHVYRVRTPQINVNNFSSWVMLLNFKLLEEAVKVINKNDINLIHSHDWLVTFAAQTLKHSYTLPVVTTIHATEAGRNDGIYNEEQQYINDIEWWTTYEAWRIICCSKYMKDEVMINFSLPEDKIRVIDNGVNEENFLTTLEDDLERRYTPLGEEVVYFIGRLVQEKGVQYLLDAAVEIIERRPNIKFIISGVGPKEADLKRQVDILGIKQQVIFTGYAGPKLRNSLYQLANVAVFPSLYEPFGIVALEAMITKTPVVVSDVGGLKEIIRHDHDGCKALPGDSHSLAEQILKLLENKRLAQKIAENGYSKVKRDYNWSKIAGDTIDVYNEVLNEYRRSEWKEISYS